MTLSEALALFLEARAAAISPATQKWYADAVQRLINAIGDVAIKEITTPMLWEWVAALRTQTHRWENCAARPAAPGGLSDYTIDRQVQGVRSFFNWLVKARHLPTSPALELEYRAANDRPPKRVSRQQLDAILYQARHKPRDYALVRFAVATGVRRGGLHGLRLADLDLPDCSAIVTEKGRKTRRVYFDPGTRDALAQWLWIREDIGSDSDAVWISEQGEPLTLSGVRQVLKRLCERAGVGNVSLHQLRHTMAYNAAKRGVDTDLLRQQLGHADIKTTYRLYIQWADEDRKDAFAADPLELGETEPRLAKRRFRIVK
jgi:integrase